MSTVKILDCTLRDGAYLVDKNFGTENIYGIVDGLLKAKIDYIEIGFLQDEGQGEGKTVYKNSMDAKKYIPADKGECEFTVLADFSRYSIDNLDDRKEDSIDAVRECFFKDERFEALEVCKKIKDKGYKLFVQPVDILGYSDLELIEFIEEVNKIEPFCFSIVDTFGSMYQEELCHCFEIINHNLVSSSQIGFHSHNNLQMSNALSQEFIRIAAGKRDIVIDGTISGMGRGAGNTPTELVAQYMVSKLGYSYNIDAILDIIDNYMDNIRTRCSWGYNTPYFIAGCYGAHVNNIQYLLGKASIQSKDIRYILNKIGKIQRKRYDYDLLEKTYLEYISSMVDDSENILKLKEALSNRDVIIVVPGHSLMKDMPQIKDYMNGIRAGVIISVNFVPDNMNVDYIYMSNVKRYQTWEKRSEFKGRKRILTSNICNRSNDENEIIISLSRLIKCGWEHMDNSTILLLRLLDFFDVKSISIAGFDGYDSANGEVKNYAADSLEKSAVRENPAAINEEIMSMLTDYKMTRKHQNIPVNFITESRFSKVFEWRENL